jgi:hypothetical protein
MRRFRLAAPSPLPIADRKTTAQVISRCIAGVVSAKALGGRCFAAMINLAAAIMALK